MLSSCSYQVDSRLLFKLPRTCPDGGIDHGSLCKLVGCHVCCWQKPLTAGQLVNSWRSVHEGRLDTTSGMKFGFTIGVECIMHQDIGPRSYLAATCPLTVAAVILQCSYRTSHCRHFTDCTSGTLEARSSQAAARCKHCGPCDLRASLLTSTGLRSKLQGLTRTHHHDYLHKQRSGFSIGGTHIRSQTSHSNTRVCQECFFAVLLARLHSFITMVMGDL